MSHMSWHISVKFQSNYNHFQPKKCIWKYNFLNIRQFVEALDVL